MGTDFESRIANVIAGLDKRIAQCEAKVEGAVDFARKTARAESEALRDDFMKFSEAARAELESFRGIAKGAAAAKAARRKGDS